MSHAVLELYDGFWTDVCDWYLELAKPRLWSDEPPSATLLWVLERTLTLLHPIMPFVTEEIWSYMPGERGLLAGSAVARGRTRRLIDDEAEEVVGRGDRRRDGAAPLPRRGGRAGGATLRARASGDRCRSQDQIARLARFEFVDDGDEEAVATVGARSTVLASEEHLRRRPGRTASRRGGRSSRRRSRAPRASSPTRAS